MMQFIVHNPIKVAVGVLLVALFGAVSLVKMPVQLTPEVQRPTITVETRWPGASPHEIEREIIQEQEEQLKSVEGLRKMSSESMDSVGRITLEFAVGTNMDEALLKVSNRLQQVPEYPEDADEPVISASSQSDRPIAWFILSERIPKREEILRFASRHPDLKAELERVARIPNPGLVLMKLRLLMREHPEITELIPAEPIDVGKLRRFAENHIEAEFERVPGVANSNVLGGLEEELQVIVDPQKLAARQLTISDVRRVLLAQNQDVSAGDLWEGKRRWVIRTLGQFRSPEQVARQLLAVRDGAPVYVADVAEVRLGYKKPDGVVRRFGNTALAINVLRETGANVPEVMRGLQQKMRELNEGILASRGLELIQVYDETEYIFSAMGLVQQNIFIGGALTMIVLMLFLHSGLRTLIFAPLIALSAVAAAYGSVWWFPLSLGLVLLAGFWFARGALVVGLAIPTSIVGTFLILGMLERSLNVISLAGLAFAVGMLVDNAVVVLENIYRRHASGVSPFRAAVAGTQEVWGAVLASTVTTVAVFLPVVFIAEEAGQLFADIALAISAAVGLSLLVSITVVPTAAARLFRHPPEEPAGPGSRQLDGPDQTEGDGQPIADSPRSPSPAGVRRTKATGRRVDKVIQWLGTAFLSAIVAANRWTLKHPLRQLGIVGLCLALSLGLSYVFGPKVEYLPTGNRNLVIGIILPPPGYNLEQLMSLGASVEEALKPYWDVDPTDPQAADRLDYPAIADFFFVARGRQVFLGVRSADPLRAAELVPLIQKVGAQLPGVITVARQTSLFESGLMAGRTIDVEITGPELERLVELGREVMMRVSGAGPFAAQGPLIAGAQVRPVPSLDLSSPEVHVEPKLLQAAELGVTTADLGYAVNALVDGAYAGDYFVGGDKIDVTIVGMPAFAQRTQNIESLPIATPTGQLMPLGAVAQVRISSGPEQINHRERQRAITIEVNPPLEIALEDAMQRIEQSIVKPLIEEGKLGTEYHITLSGTADRLRATWDALKFNFLLAVLITYLLMAALFESWLYPLVIILTVPLGAVGGILGLQLLNLFILQSLDVLTMLGFVILIGTVVNNPILIVHQSLNHMREDGMPAYEAILESVRNRVRPICMTTMTTVLGLLPLVLFPGAGSELYRGLGSVVLGGLLVSMFFTLVMVPAAFALMLRIRAALWEGTKRRRPRQTQTVRKSSPSEVATVEALQTPEASRSR
ncbi:MAG: acriflavine resistance protein B [Pirellulaceae bacterium]|nr:MAG: acriflavine resistance protein B [Pirellulaceae bacterium]